MSNCDWCGRPGVPYEYKGLEFDGLTAVHGQRLCPACSQDHIDREGVNILVVDDRVSVPPYTVNTVRDRDTVHPALPRELRGVDGRDFKAQRRGHAGRNAAEQRHSGQPADTAGGADARADAAGAEPEPSGQRGQHRAGNA